MIFLPKQADALVVACVSIAVTAICIALTMPLKSQKPLGSMNSTTTSARDAAFVQKNAPVTIFK